MKLLISFLRFVSLGLVLVPICWAFSSEQVKKSGTVQRGQGKQHTVDVENHRKDWINRSLDYYSKMMREERRRKMGQVRGYDDPDYQDTFAALAARHYFALRKIKEGKLQHAELIYRRIIDNLLDEDHDECSHAKLAVTTLLLALLMQRRGASAKETRSVFLTFLKVVSMDEDTECACSAKVVGAFALFEMKQGNTIKSLSLARRAFQLDPTVMNPLLEWKQFRDAARQQERFRQAKMTARGSTLEPNRSV